MGVTISLDFSDLVKNIPRLNKVVDDAKKQGLRKIGDEILRLSQREVPHDTGQLQNTGKVEETDTYVEVGYHKVYAARLHEHPEYNFKNGRKGKYLEDPIKNNLSTFLSYFAESLRRVL